MTDKIYALELDREDWQRRMAELGEPKFRADQICAWLWQKHTDCAEDMTNLSKTLREKLAQTIEFAYPALLREQRSKDGTRKFLWRLSDGECVESVLMKEGDRLTLCISTQVGCPLQCTFCATGLSGFVRNLTAGEIAGQALASEKLLGREINNIVYMGMGEPFLNTDEVLRSMRLLNSPELRNFGIRRMTVSTSGVIPGIMALAESGLGVRLAVSLHSADDELRSVIMPVNHSWPLAELRAALQEYQKKTGDRITIEYALLGGVNDSVEHARLLVRYLKGIHVFVNLIPFNSVDGRYERPKAEDVLRFRSVLHTAGFEAEIRAEHGADIDAACGQLRRKTIAGVAAPLESPTVIAPKRDAPRNDTETRSPRAAKPERTYGGRISREKVRTAAKPSGGYIAERGKRRKTDAEPQERYRSGKMKEARPSYRSENGGRPSYDDTLRTERARPSYPERGRTGSQDGGRSRADKNSSAKNTKKYVPSHRINVEEKPKGAFAVFYGKSARPKKQNKPARGGKQK